MIIGNARLLHLLFTEFCVKLLSATPQLPLSYENNWADATFESHTDPGLVTYYANCRVNALGTDQKTVWEAQAKLCLTFRVEDMPVTEEGCIKFAEAFGHVIEEALEKFRQQAQQIVDPDAMIFVAPEN